MANMKAYRALVLESRRRGLPERYRSDLIEIDKDDLRKADAPERFIWILRKQGTWLLTDWYRLFDRHQCCYFHGREEAHYYVWDGSLHEVSQLDAINTMRRWRTPDCTPYQNMEEARWWFEAFWDDKRPEADMIAAEHSDWREILPVGRSFVYQQGMEVAV